MGHQVVPEETMREIIEHWEVLMKEGVMREVHHLIKMSIVRDVLIRTSRIVGLRNLMVKVGQLGV